MKVKLSVLGREVNGKQINKFALNLAFARASKVL